MKDGKTKRMTDWAVFEFLTVPDRLSDSDAINVLELRRSKSKGLVQIVFCKK